MKFLLLKALLLSRRKDQGFTLPMVIGIGFVMVLLSTVSLVQSGEENINALSQQGSSDSLAIAEIGVARYRNVLNNNRALAVNDLANWAGLDTQTCDVISAVGNDGLANNADDAWKDVVVDGNAIGSYRLVDYEYDQNPNNAGDDNNFDQVDDANNDFNGDDNGDARGFLVIQGKDTPGVNIGNASISQIQVEIPLGVNTSDLDDLNPAIWIGQSSVTNLGNDLDLNGANVVYKEPSIAGASGCTITGVDAVTGENTISDARDLPPLAVLTGITPRPLASGAITNINSNTAINNFNNNEIILGTSLDDNDLDSVIAAINAADGRYYYNVPGDLDLIDNQSIIADGTSEVILVVNGNLNINTGVAGNTVRLINSSHISETGAPTPNDVDRYLEIHVTGDVNISGNGTLNVTGLLRANGTVNIADNVDVNVTGAIWANNWNNTTSGTVNIGTDDYRFYSITANRTPAPLTYRPSGWVTQEAN